MVETRRRGVRPDRKPGPTCYLRTDRDAPNRKVIAVDLAPPRAPAWKTIVPEGKEAIENVTLVGGRIVAQYLGGRAEPALAVQPRRPRAGRHCAPGGAPVEDMGGRRGLAGRLFHVQLAALPDHGLSRIDPAIAGSRTPFEAAKPPSMRAGTRRTERCSPLRRTARACRSSSRRRRACRWTARIRRCCTATAGSRSARCRRTARTCPAWLELGGIWVTANMRGGAEYGEAWHKAGMLEKKQNVFDDFIAVAENLVRRSTRRPARLGIMGGSNGGLLVGAVEEQRPGSVRRGAARRRRDGHAALRQVHGRPCLGHRVRLVVGSRQFRISSSSTRRCRT